MDISNKDTNRSCDGIRGGYERFNWASLKSIPTSEREHYLGQSIQVGIATRGGKFYRHDWYYKGGDTRRTIDRSIINDKMGSNKNVSTSNIKDEKLLVKQYEDQYISKLLGVKSSFKKEEIEDLRNTQAKSKSYTNDRTTKICDLTSSKKHIRSDKCYKEVRSKVSKSKHTYRSLSRSISPNKIV
ncbi:hypothetical protein cand_011920 [Cryptosporidium andersoni]|uniref:Multiple myeloma tumor-associated protein 2-like N-terminal domain-containing protein n=1 Tax=Cryptosporidium andersoni TaxID=117008 RepID=A0A1J4MEK3_9CRYT|nr:hypothetical protein cand_011920 [Cryptosporidium andersoni]